MTQATVAQPRRPGALKRFFRPFLLLRESKVGMLGAGIVVFWIICAFLAPLIAPFPPNANYMVNVKPGTEYILAAGQTLDQVPVEEACSPITSGENAGKFHCGTFHFGTDTNGRDILSRIFWGARQTLLYAPLATFAAYLVGIPMGLWAGYRRGRVDAGLSYISNVILSFPVMVLYVLIIATLGASGWNIIAAVTFASAPGVFRIVRGLTLDLRTREYIYAAETRGESGAWIIFLEILPNARGPLIVDAMLRLGYVTITIGTLGFLGLGLPPPDPDWGKMVSEGRSYIQILPHMVLFPCLAISSLVLGFNLLADGLREVSLRD